MKNNLYWSIYKSIEREVINLSNLIHFDETQLSIYSIKITELLIRTVVEIESISKYLYSINGGEKPNDNKLFFDTDCIYFLDQKWQLSKKKVLVSFPNFYFELADNQVLTPLKKANKRGSSSADWLKAYQAVKHNRGANLKKVNLKLLIRALAGLYILNLYYKDTIFELHLDGTGTNFDNNVGSEIYSIKSHINQTISIEIDYQKNSDFDECTYLIVPKEETKNKVQEAMRKINQETTKNYFAHLGNEIKKTIPEIVKSSEPKLILTKEFIEKVKMENSNKVLRENRHIILEAFQGLRYQAVLNIGQF